MYNAVLLLWWKHKIKQKKINVVFCFCFFFSLWTISSYVDVFTMI